MTARTRVEAADAVVSVQAEGVDQATKKIKEVDKALGTLPAAAAKADAAAADSSKRWQELAGKVGAAVGAFASVQAMDLSTSSGLMGLAGVAATATAALGPLGLAVTAAAAAVNLLGKAWSDAEPSAEEMKAKLEAQKKAADEAKAAYQGLSAATGGFISTLDPAKQREFLTNQTRLAELDKEATDAAEDLNKALVARANNYARIFGEENAKRPEQFAFLETERVARQKLIDEQRREIQLRQEGLAQIAKGAGEQKGLIDGIDNETKAVRAAAFSWAEYVDKVERARMASGDSLLAELEASEKARADARDREIMAAQAHDVALFQLNQDARKRESAAMTSFFRGTHAAETKRTQEAIALANAERDAKYAAAGAIVGSARGIAEAVGASQKVILGLQGVEYGILAAGETAKAFASAAVFDYWGATQHGFAAAQAAVASVMAFRAAGTSGGGESAGASAPAGGGAGVASVSAPSQAQSTETGPTTINVNFDRAQRPLTRGDERAIYAGVSRALSGPGGARGLGSRRVAS